MAGIKSMRRIKELDFLTGFLEEHPDVTKDDVLVITSRNLGWSFKKTKELLKTLDATGEIDHQVFNVEEDFIERPDTWGKTVNELEL